MGIDYYVCDVCGESYPDCGPCGMCGNCESSLCGDCHDKAKEKYGVHTDDSYDSLKCQLCTKDVITNDVMVEFLLKRIGVTRKQVEKDIRNANK